MSSVLFISETLLARTQPPSPNPPQHSYLGITTLPVPSPPSPEIMKRICRTWNPQTRRTLEQMKKDAKIEELRRQQLEDESPSLAHAGIFRAAEKRFEPHKRREIPAGSMNTEIHAWFSNKAAQELTTAHDGSKVVEKKWKVYLDTLYGKEINATAIGKFNRKGKELFHRDYKTKYSDAIYMGTVVLDEKPKK